MDRPADVGGLNYWLKADLSTQAYAQGMLLDTEFVQRNGNGQLSDKAFVELLYHNALSRDADAPGLEFWSDYLRAGHSRAELLEQWIQSAEVVGVQYGAEGLWLV